MRLRLQAEAEQKNCQLIDALRDVTVDVANGLLHRESVGELATTPDRVRQPLGTASEREMTTAIQSV